MIIEESFGNLRRSPGRQNHADEPESHGASSASERATPLSSSSDNLEDLLSKTIRTESAFQSFVKTASPDALSTVQHILERNKASCERLLSIIGEHQDHLKAEQIQKNRRAVFAELQSKFTRSPRCAY